MTRPSPASSPAFVSLLCTGGFGTRIRLRRSSRVITLISGIFRLYSCCMPMLCIIFFEYCINCPGVDSLKSIPDMKAWRRRDIVSRFLNNLSKILLTILVYVFLLEYGFPVSSVNRYSLGVKCTLFTMTWTSSSGMIRWKAPYFRDVLYVFRMILL